MPILNSKISNFFGKTPWRTLPKEVTSFVRKNRRFLSYKAIYFLLRQRCYSHDHIQNLHNIEKFLPEIGGQRQDPGFIKLVKTASCMGLFVDDKRACLRRFDEKGDVYKSPRHFCFGVLSANAFIQNSKREELEAASPEDSSLGQIEPAAQHDGVSVVQLKKAGYLNDLPKIETTKDLLVNYFWNKRVLTSLRRQMLYGVVPAFILSGATAVFFPYILASMALKIGVSAVLIGFLAYSLQTFRTALLSRSVPITHSKNEKIFGKIFALINFDQLAAVVKESCSIGQRNEILQIVYSVDPHRADRLGESFKDLLAPEPGITF